MGLLMECFWTTQYDDATNELREFPQNRCMRVYAYAHIFELLSKETRTLKLDLTAMIVDKLVYGLGGFVSRFLCV